VNGTPLYEAAGVVTGLSLGILVINGDVGPWLR
jgi:hypothetical protein